MKHYYTDNNTGISYTLSGNVYLPNLVLPHSDDTIGVWGCGCPVDTSAEEQKHRPNRQVRQRYRAYLKTHRKPFYTSLKMQCKLDAPLQEMDARASEMYERLIASLAKKEGIIEALKAEDMMAWVGAIKNITNQAREIVYNEVIYT